MKKKENICIVIPAYNEEENIEALIQQWYPIIEKIGNNSFLFVVDDGSKDKTYSILTHLTKKYKQIKVFTKQNEGHGKTIRYGYEKALSYKTDYVFQIDSDRQTDPMEFWKFWEKRKEHTVIIGDRKKRKDGFLRKIVTNILRFLIFCFFRIDVKDANTPFRLMERKCLEKYLSKIPKKLSLTNVYLSIFFIFYKEDVCFLPISFQKREKGTNSLNIKKIIKIGIQTYDDFKMLRKKLIKSKNTKYFHLLFCFFLAFLCITLCSKCSFLYPFNDGNDMNAYLTVGKGIKHGLVPYRDLFEQKGPLLYMIYFIGSLLSETSFIGIYICEILSFTFFLYYSSKFIKLFLKEQYVYVLLPLFAAFITTSPFFFHGGSAEEFVLPFIMYSLYHLFSYLKKERKVDFSFLFKNGLSAGCIFMIKYNLLGFHFGFMLILLFDILIKKDGSFLKTCFSFLLGMFFPFCLFFLYFLFHHAGKDFIDTYFLFNLFGYKMGLDAHLKWIVVKENLTEIFSKNFFSFFLLCTGFLYFLLHKKALSSWYRMIPIFLFVLLLFGVYFGGRTYPYYYLVATPFYLFGMMTIFLFIEEYYFKIPSFLLLISSIVSLFLSFSISLKNPNLSFSSHKKEDLVQYQFAKEMKKEKDTSFLEYKSLDNGFYLAMNMVPKERYFINLNVHPKIFPDIIKDQEKRIKEKKVNFIILKRSEEDKKKISLQITENYKLIQKQYQVYEGKMYTYFLFKRKKVV